MIRHLVRRHRLHRAGFDFLKIADRGAPMMNERIKTLWVTDLRTHPELQGRKMLHNPETGNFCCMGRLCELAVLEGVIPPGVLSLPSKVKPTARVEYGDEENGFVLPIEVMEWAELKQDNPEFLGRNGMDESLGSVNDTGLDFMQIADLIEEYL